MTGAASNTSHDSPASAEQHALSADERRRALNRQAQARARERRRRLLADPAADPDAARDAQATAARERERTRIRNQRYRLNRGDAADAAREQRRRILADPTRKLDERLWKLQTAKESKIVCVPSATVIVSEEKKVTRYESNIGCTSLTDAMLLRTSRTFPAMRMNCTAAGAHSATGAGGD